MQFKLAFMAVAAVAGFASAVKGTAAEAPPVTMHVFEGQYLSTQFITLATSTILDCPPGVDCPASSMIRTSYVYPSVTICPTSSISMETPSGYGSIPMSTVTAISSAGTSDTISAIESSSTTTSATESEVSVNPVSTGPSQSTTTITTTLHVTATTTIEVSSSTLSINTPPAYSPPHSFSYTPSSIASVGPTGATGTGAMSPSTNGTLSTPPATPTSTFVPYEGSAEKVLQGSLAGFLMVAAAILV